MEEAKESNVHKSWARHLLVCFPSFSLSFFLSFFLSSFLSLLQEDLSEETSFAAGILEKKP